MVILNEKHASIRISEDNVRSGRSQLREYGTLVSPRWPVVGTKSAQMAAPVRSMTELILTEKRAPIRTAADGPSPVWPLVGPDGDQMGRGGGILGRRCCMYELDGVDIGIWNRSKEAKCDSAGTVSGL